MYTFSSHDGVQMSVHIHCFFGKIKCNLVFSDWDSITKEDLEFSVGSKHGVWDVKEPLLEGMEDNDYQQYGTPPNLSYQSHFQGYSNGGYPPKQESFRSYDSK